MSRRNYYAVVAVAYIARGDSKPLASFDLAQAAGFPPRYLL